MGWYKGKVMEQQTYREKVREHLFKEHDYPDYEYWDGAGLAGEHHSFHAYGICVDYSGNEIPQHHHDFPMQYEPHGFGYMVND